MTNESEDRAYFFDEDTANWERYHPSRENTTMENTIVAILSTTILPLDGMYAVASEETLGPLSEGVVCSPAIATSADLAVAYPIPPVTIQWKGTPHYIGHPDTAQFVESRGAIKAPSNLFRGLEVGQAALCVAIKQGRSTRATLGHTEAHQEVTKDDLVIRIIQRVG